MATSAPVPMATPRSAWASAGASLMPSPTIATTEPAGLEPLDGRGLVGGQDLGDRRAPAGCPTWRGDGLGGGPRRRR